MKAKPSNEQTNGSIIITVSAENDYDRVILYEVCTNGVQVRRPDGSLVPMAPTQQALGNLVANCYTKAEIGALLSTSAIYTWAMNSMVIVCG